MGALYPSQSVSGYNSNPPPDDGSTGSTNLITWAGIKTKIGDPLNNFDTAVNTAIIGAFGKTLDGSGIVSTGISYSVLSGDQGKLIKATASGITITTPATSVGTPFMFAVANQSTGTITLAGASANVDGAASQVIQAGGGCVVKFDGTNWFTFGLQAAQPSLTGSQHGFDAPVNAAITCSVATNILTVNLKTKAGNDPSSGDPVLIPFRDSTIGLGDPVWVSQTSALNMTTNAAGATLGVGNNVPFKLWVGVFNNGGTLALALYQTVGFSGAIPTNLQSWAEEVPTSTTGISAAATSAGTWYTPNGTSLSGKSFRILGYLEWSAGLPTAGNYSINPTAIQLFGPGVMKPGAIVQVAYGLNSTAKTISSATLTATNLTQSITPFHASDVVMARATGQLSVAASNTLNFAQLARNSNSNVFGTISNAPANTNVPITLEGIDAPGTVSSTTYGVYIESDGTHNVTFSGSLNGTTTQATLVLTELMT